MPLRVVLLAGAVLLAAVAVCALWKVQDAGPSRSEGLSGTRSSGS